MDSVFGKSSTGFTRDDKDKLARKRALNPALSGAAAGAAGGALVANVGGDALRRASQKKVFNTSTNDYQWVSRGRVSPRRAKLGRIGAKTSAKALPLTFAAGGLGAVANVNGIQMSHLWNKKDKVYDQAAKVKEASKVSKMAFDSREEQREWAKKLLANIRVSRTGAQLGPSIPSGSYTGDQSVGLPKGTEPYGTNKRGFGKLSIRGGKPARLKRKKTSSKVSKASDDLQLAAARLGSDYVRRLGSDYVRLAVEDYRKKNNIRPKALLNQKFLDGLSIGAAATFMLTPVFSSLSSRPGPDEYIVGVKKAAESVPQDPIRKSIFNRD